MTAPSSPELGTTSIATDLVPGDPSAVRGFAANLGELAGNLEASGDTLKTVSLPSWRGEAADSFHDAFAPVPGLWIDAGGILEECKSALEQHADAIVTAQSQAQSAIDAWEEGEQASATARSNYDRAMREYTNRPFAERMYLHPPYLDDSQGVELRREAQQILNEAREALHNSGNEALTALARITGGSLTGGSSEGPGTETSTSWGSIDREVGKREFGDESWSGRTEGDTGDGAKPLFGLKAVIGSASAGAWVWRASGSTTHYVGPFNGHLFAEGGIDVLSADAKGSVQISGDGLSLKGDASAELVGVSGSAGYSTDYSTVEISGEAGAGAYAEGEFSVGKDGVEVGGEVLLGAKAGVDGEVTVGGIGLSGSAEGWVGAGAGADATFSWDDGKLSIGASAGAAWGAGGSVGFGITLDFEEMGKTAGDLWDTVSGWW